MSRTFIQIVRGQQNAFDAADLLQRDGFNFVVISSHDDGIEVTDPAGVIKISEVGERDLFAVLATNRRLAVMFD